MPNPTITTEDGAVLSVGDRAYNYYDMKPGTIGNLDTWRNMPDTWFDFNHDDGTTSLLNGSRICSTVFAQRRNFKDA